MVQSIFTLEVAVDNIGGYNWRHHGDFSNPLLTPPHHTQGLKNREKQIFSNFDLKVAHGGFKAKIEKSPW